MVSATTKLQDSDTISPSTVSFDGESTKEPEVKLTRIEKFKLTMQFLKPLAITMFIDVGLPLAIYYVLKIWLSVIIALVLSGIPPLVHVIYTFWKKRKVDVLGCIIVVSFILSAVLSVISGDVRVALLRDSTTTAIVSLMFFITLIPLQTRWFKIRPLVFIIGQQMMAGAAPYTWTDIEGEKHEEESMEFIWQFSSMFRKYCYIMSGLWGVLLMGEFIAKVIMIQSSLTVDQVVLYGNIIVIVVVVSMTVGSTIASSIMRKKIAASIAEWRLENDFTKK
ncbi:uncharacterized protein EV154DRAFT_423056 [Mucor mucedo]|uniref:uncharacterized protein n=1 Tax=Mucor mucedo TaxID=29922 RepID=UPI00221FC401|nr:uncharacterized protein EV154DRAFT_423056 [Mucor mucedo]KAI7889864.1 hypothetical protein EV154DRAFT_423056 [Mucor mucedo]